jgi:hypothetical protein
VTPTNVKDGTRFCYRCLRVSTCARKTDIRLLKLSHCRTITQARMLTSMSCTLSLQYTIFGYQHQQKPPEYRVIFPSTPHVPKTPQVILPSGIRTRTFDTMNAMIISHPSPPPSRIPPRRRTLQTMPCITHHSTHPTNTLPAIPTIPLTPRARPIHNPIHIHINIHTIRLRMQRCITIIAARRIPCLRRDLVVLDTDCGNDGLDGWSR